MEFIVALVSGPSLQQVAETGSRKPKEPLEIFRESIRRVVRDLPSSLSYSANKPQVDIETELTRNFITSVASRRRSMLGRDIGTEFRLLYDIKDIRDELHILKTLAGTQAAVWRQAFQSNHWNDGRSFLYHHAYTPAGVRMELKEMAREAAAAQDSVG